MSIRSILRCISSGLIVLFALSSTLCMAAGNPARSSTAGAPYVDIWDYLPTWQQQDGWLDTTYWLNENFNDICGDTFCEGDYANLHALSYRCSVQSGSGIVGECVWIFAGSQEQIDASSGKIIAEPHIWQCATPLAPGTRAEELAQALANRQPLFALLPHTGKTLYDSIAENCLY